MEPVEIVLKLTLRGIRPPIWRRVRVASDMTLRRLHQIIQEAMGRDDAHLHEFEIGGRRYGEPADEFWPGMERTFSENNVKLDVLVDQGVKRFQYLYDFGDGWEHAVAIEEVQPLDPERVADRRQARLPARGLRRRARLLPAHRGSGGPGRQGACRADRMGWRRVRPRTLRC